MKTFALRNDRGVTLTELLVVMLIVGLLSSIAVPVYINRMEDARINMAKGEARQIAEAEESCALLHGYYVPFQVLDDHPSNPNSGGNAEEIDNDNISAIRLINPLIRPENQFGAFGVGQYTLNRTDIPRVNDMLNHWQGPFMTFHRFYIGTYPDPYDPGYVTDPVLFLDFPLDPWGNPYRFYSPLGLVGTNAEQSDLTNVTVDFSNGALTTDDDRNFDRYAVVSWGRDGVSDTSIGGDYRDDVVHLFGVGGVESSFGLRI